MAGGKETPRQKMIGMMYLVLTALLALNVSKEIIAAFVTLNDKLDASSMIIGEKVWDNYHEFSEKRATLVAQEADMTEFNQWNDKAQELKKETAAMIGFILGESNDMIEESEGENWVASKDDDGNITALKPLIDITSMDNYDIPTNMFVGGNPNSPNERGMALRQKIHNYRDLVCGMLGTYKYGKNDFKFVAPTDDSGMDDALKTANPQDTAHLRQFYHLLTIPEKLHAHGEDTEMPWASVTFDHAPIVAAAAMFTSLKLDIKNAEAEATDFMLAKIDAPAFPINKIVPTPFAPTSYINLGDSLGLDVFVAAFDTTSVAMIKWGMDEDTLPERWTETSGKINLAGAKPGPHKVKGVIGVQERGAISWKPWEFDFNVGQPMGVIAQPNMRVLYRGFDNILEGTASGFPADKVRLSSSQVNLTKRGNQWIAKPRAGNRTASISVVATKDDGSSANLGSFEYKVKPLPKPTAYFGGITNGSRPSLGTVRATINNGISIRYDESVNLPGVRFVKVGGKVSVESINRKGKIDSNGKFDNSAVSILKQSAGKQVTIMMDYRDPLGTKFTAPIVFTVRG